MKDTSLIIAIIVAVSTLAGAAMGGFFAYLGSRNMKFITRIKAEHLKACEQIKAYYNLEALYADAISKQSQTPAETIKKQYRSKVEESDSFVRPTWTMRQAQDSIDRFC